jgi:hypothetical protein
VKHPGAVCAKCGARAMSHERNPVLRPARQAGRWYVLVLTAFAAVSMIWIISEEAGSRAKPPILVATEH